MRREVWKFGLPVARDARVVMPQGAQVMSVGPNEEMLDWLWLWAEVDPDADREERRFVVQGTGHGLVNYRGSFIGTVQAPHGLVWHVWYASREVPS